jgi:hypothetical protein
MFIRSLGIFWLLVTALHCLTSGGPVSAAITLPHLFSDNMVIQRDMPVPVFPFYFVQLPPYRAGAGLPLIREAQRATLAVPNTGMAVAIDIGSYPDCHCPNKQDVGKRLALGALARDYGRKELVYAGPLYRSMAVEGNKVRVQFDHVGSGLVTRDGAQELTCFEVAGADRKFVSAAGRIDGSSVVVSCRRCRTRSPCDWLGTTSPSPT